MGINQCDDGNKISGDGCNEFCKIEAQYECYGGSKDTADICINRRPPDIIFKYYANRTAFISFTEMVHSDKPIEKMLSFEIEGLPDIIVEFTMLPYNQQKMKRLEFTLNFNSSLSGNEVFF